MRPEVNLTDLFVQRRQRLSAQITDGIAVISSPGVSPDPLLTDKNLFYLTGLPSKKAVLLLAPRTVVVEAWETLHGPEVGRGHRVKEVLFVEEKTEREIAIDGTGDDHEAIRKSTGVEKVLGLSKLVETLSTALMGEEALWVNVAARPILTQALTPDLAWIHGIRERFPWVRIRNAAGTIHTMRRVKDTYEVECLREAFRNHTEVYETIMRALKPGTNEALGEAIWEYETQTQGSRVTGKSLDTYVSHIIVAAGKHTATAHYMDNNQDIRDGDLVLIDSGVSVNGYSSDITRTFPANGRFTPRQRELYQVVLDAQKAAIRTMKPGSTARRAHEAVYKTLEKNGLAKYNYGMAGHPVGLNIHDANSNTSWDRDQPFEPGVVLVIEPFLAIPEEGIGIRTEDGVLITEKGHEVLTGPAKEIADVEKLCAR